MATITKLVVVSILLMLNLFQWNLCGVWAIEDHTTKFLWSPDPCTRTGLHGLPVFFLHFFQKRTFWGTCCRGFYGLDALAVTWWTTSEHWRKLKATTRKNHPLTSILDSSTSKLLALLPLCQLSDGSNKVIGLFQQYNINNRIRSQRPTRYGYGILPALCPAAQCPIVN